MEEIYECVCGSVVSATLGDWIMLGWLIKNGAGKPYNRINVCLFCCRWNVCDCLCMNPKATLMADEDVV